MKSIQLITALVLLTATVCQGQIKNTKTETVKINGNCNMCKSNIETAGNERKYLWWFGIQTPRWLPLPMIV